MGDPQTLPSVDETRERIAHSMHPALARWKETLSEEISNLKSRHQAERTSLVDRQRQARTELKASQAERQASEPRRRQARFRHGLGGLWDRLNGTQARIRRDNKDDAWQCHLRDQKQIDDLVFVQTEGRRNLKRQHAQDRSRFAFEARELSRDRDRFDEMRKADDFQKGHYLSPNR